MPRPSSPPALRMFDPLDSGRRVEIGIKELRASSREACGSIDMTGTLAVEGGPILGIPFVPDAAVLKFERPPLALIAMSAPGQRYVDAEIRVQDLDSGSCGGADAEVDIVPRADLTRLRIRIDLQAHTVRLRDAGPQVVGGLGTWTSDGLNGPAIGSVEFGVEIPAPIGL